VAEEETRNAMMAALQEAVPPRARLIADSITFQQEADTKSLGRSVEFTMTAGVEYVIPIDPVAVRREVVGLEPSEAMATLQQNLQLARAPDIYRDPDWLGTLPVFSSRIQVRVEYEGAISGE
jgi:hypothetical protein